MKDYRTATYEKLRTSPTAFVRRNVQKLLQSPRQVLHDFENVLQSHSSGQDSYSPDTATDVRTGGWHFSSAEDRAVAQDLVNLHSNDQSVTHIYSQSDGRMTCALRNYRPANFRFSTCIIDTQWPAFLGDVQKLNGTMPFIGFRARNLSRSILDEGVARLGRQVVVQQLEKGVLKHDSLRVNAQNLLVSDPVGYLPWLVYHCNYHTNLIVVLSEVCVSDSEVVQDYLAVADAVIAPVGMITRADHTANLYEYLDAKEIRQHIMSAILSFGDKPRNMLLPVYRGRTLCPELFDADPDCEAICYIREPSQSRHTTFDGMIDELAGNVEAIYFREEVALRFRDLAVKAEIQKDPADLLIASLKSGVRYECKTLSSAD